ncbi:hypothetical protein BH11GEM1_BH11GEM1_31670 [soil metagenome]
MASYLAHGDLFVSLTDIAEQGELINHGFVRRDIEEHGRAPPMLGQYDRPRGSLDLLDELRGVRAEFGHWPNIQTRLEFGQGGLWEGLSFGTEKRTDWFE